MTSLNTARIRIRFGRKVLWFIVFLFFLSAVMVPLSHAVSKDSKTIRVGLFPLEPLSYIDDSGRAQGLYPDLVRNIFKNRKIEFVEGSWAQCLERLQDGRIDLMTIIAYSTSRSKIMDFSKEPVLNVWGQAFARPEDKITSIRDLENQTVAVMEKDLIAQNFMNTLTTLGITCSFIELPTHYNVFEAVKNGQAKAGVSPNHFGLMHCKDFGLAPTSIVFTPFPVFFSVKRGHHNDLIRQIDNQLIQWKKDKSSFYYECLAYWMSDTQFKRKFIPPWIIWLVGAVFVCAMVLLIMNRWLNMKVKKKTRELRTKEREYRELVESANSIILRWDKDGQVHFINSYGLELFGFSWDEIKDKGFLENIIPSSSTDGVDQSSLLSEIKENPEAFTLKESENVCKDGRRVFIQWSNRPIYDEDGHFIEMLSIGTDISERKQLEADLFQSRKMEAIGTLAGGIAHDFNNILSIIIGNTELLKYSHKKDSEEWGYIQDLMEASKRASELVAQILAFSRKTNVPKQIFSVSKVIHDALSMIRSTFPSTISVEQSIESDCMVFGSTGQIQQVVMNLCTNAYHAMEDRGGTISISVTETHKKDPLPGIQGTGYACLEVRDTGPGIPHHIKSHIFDPYFTTKKQDKGTGLGLAVVHGIIKDHKGHISVESEEGKGATFRVLLPIFSGTMSSSESDLEKQLLAGGSESIIVVDDEQAIVNSTGHILEKQGYHVTGFTGSAEALEHFKQHPGRYNLMITDMTMPGMTGDQLARHIHDVCPGFPIVLCTGYSDRITAEKALEMGIMCFINKPVVSTEILRVIRDILDQSVPDHTPKRH